MGELVLTTYDWVPEPPRGHVRDIRIRWALEEAGLAYRVATTPFRDRGAQHFAHQPFGQTPWLTDGDISIFESGAILLHLGEKSAALMPRDASGRAAVQEWVFAALNSMEMVSVPWSLFQFSGDTSSERWKQFDDWLGVRLGQLDGVLAEREWLAGPGFSVADIAMVEVLRLIDRFDRMATFAALKAYVARATARPAFAKALADQLAHFAAADRAQAG